MGWGSLVRTSSITLVRTKDPIDIFVVLREHEAKPKAGDLARKGRDLGNRSTPDDQVSDLDMSEAKRLKAL
jgi:hypothetical protein